MGTVVVFLAICAPLVYLAWKLAYHLGYRKGEFDRALFDRSEVVRASMAQHRAEALTGVWERRARVLLQVGDRSEP